MIRHFLTLFNQNMLVNSHTTFGCGIAHSSIFFIFSLVRESELHLRKYEKKIQRQLCMISLATTCYPISRSHLDKNAFATALYPINCLHLGTFRACHSHLSINRVYFSLCVSDVDECVERPGICRNGDCLNLVGSFSCICHRGFRLSSEKDGCVGK